jgi:hypothetical protein
MLVNEAVIQAMMAGRFFIFILCKGFEVLMAEDRFSDYPPPHASYQ